MALDVTVGVVTQDAELVITQEMDWPFVRPDEV